MSEVSLGDDNVGSSRDADVDAAYDDGDPAGGAPEPSPDALDGLDGQDGQEQTSHSADVEAGFEE